MVGILGWRPVPALLFTLAAAAALIPWYFGPPPSVRYLFPIYPLYAVFTAAGITRGTRRFEGRAGLAAGAALSAAVLALPVGYHPTLREIRASFGMIKRDEVLARELPSYLLWKFVEPEDRAILISEHDRFYCPASLAYRTTYIPVRLWRTPEEWRLGLERYGITVVVYYRTLADRSGAHPRSRRQRDPPARRAKSKRMALSRCSPRGSRGDGSRRRSPVSLRSSPPGVRRRWADYPIYPGFTSRRSISGGGWS